MKGQHYRELGILIVQFQTLEQTIAFFTGELISSDQTLNNVIISKLSFRNLCDVFITLFNHKCNSLKLKKEIKKIFSIINKIEDKRNTYVHSTWGFPSSRLGVGALRIKKKIKKNKFLFDWELLKEDDIKNTTVEIQKAISEILEVMKKAKNENLISFSTIVKI